MNNNKTKPQQCTENERTSQNPNSKCKTISRIHTYLRN